MIASSGGVGGTFNIKRSGGIVSVASGASMTIQGGSTVNISNDNSSTLVMSTVPDATYGFMVSNSTLANNGVLPVLNNVLSGGRQFGGHRQQRHFQRERRNADRWCDHRQRHVQRDEHRHGHRASIVQGTASAANAGLGSASVGPNASVEPERARRILPNLIVDNQGTMNVTGGNHTMAAVGLDPAIGNNVNNFTGNLNVSGNGTILWVVVPGISELNFFRARVPVPVAACVLGLERGTTHVEPDWGIKRDLLIDQ